MLCNALAYTYLLIFWPSTISLRLFPSFCYKQNQTDSSIIADMGKLPADALVKQNMPIRRCFEFCLNNFKAFSLAQLISSTPFYPQSNLFSSVGNLPLSLINTHTYCVHLFWAWHQQDNSVEQIYISLWMPRVGLGGNKLFELNSLLC